MTETTKRTTKTRKRTAAKATGKRRTTAKPAPKATRKTATKAAKKPVRETGRKAAKKPARKAAAKPAAPAATPKPRDPRLPSAGTTLLRPYKGKDYEIEILETGFRWNGDEYRSLSKLASVITGQKSINGYLWARLTEPKQAATKRTTRATAAGRKSASKGAPEGDTAQQGASDAPSA